jgi:glycine/D-amino acid oxidase-like deaminating enzyme
MKGERKALELLREGVEMLDGLEALVSAEKIDCDFRRCGRFRGAMRPEHYEPMAREMEDLKRVIGVETAMIPRAEQRREIATDVFHGGSLLPQDACLHPGKYHAGLLARATEAGAEVRGHSVVRAIRAEASGFTLAFDGFEIVARDVLIATNGYTRNVGAYFDKRIVSISSAQIATAPLAPGVLDRLMPTRRVYGNTSRALTYFRPAPDEPRIILGGRVSYLYSDNDPRAYAHLARDLLRLLPDIGDVEVSHGWTGAIAQTYDSFPHLGRTADGLHFAIGYCGTGVSRSTHFGRKIALQMLGRREGASAFDELKFPAHPLWRFAPIGVPLAEGVMRIRDATGL